MMFMSSSTVVQYSSLLVFPIFLTVRKEKVFEWLWCLTSKNERFVLAVVISNKLGWVSFQNQEALKMYTPRCMIYCFLLGYGT